MWRTKSHSKTLQSYFKLEGGYAAPPQKQQTWSTKSPSKTNQIVVMGQLEERNASFFVDTGSTVSLVSRSTVQFLNLTDQVVADNVKLTSFTANTIKTYGKVRLKMRLANYQISHEMIVTDLVDTQCLLGMDFLSQNSINIDVTRQCLSTQAGDVKFVKRTAPQTKTSRIKGAKSYTIPANTVMFITAKAVDYDPSKVFTGFVEPKTAMCDRGLLVDGALCLTDKNVLPVRVTNLTDSPVYIRKNMVLGTMYPVNNECDSNYRNLRVDDNPEPEKVNKVSSELKLNSETDKRPRKTSKEWTKSDLWKALRIHDIKDITNEERSRLKDLVWRYRTCFSNGPFDLGECTIYEGDIQLKQDFTPAWTPARPIPYKLRPEMERQVKGLEEAGVIEKCTSKSLWNSQVFLVRKPHSPGKMRLVVDMRSVNLQCLPDNYQMPLIGHVVDKVGGHKWFSTFDCSQSFHQIKYNEASKPITAFTTANGSRYWFKRLIMGHKTSGAQFSRCMAKIMMNLPFEQLIFFLDDLLLASNCVDSHLSRLEIVFQRLTAAGIKLSPEKSNFLKKEVKFVGITLNSEGLKITEDRVKALLELKSPTSKKTLQSLLGFFGYNRKWIPHYASLTRCMYKLLSKDTPFHWSAECEENLKKLKEAVAKNITLAVPDLMDREQSYHLTIDGSKYGMAAHLSQKINGKRRIIGYFSKAVPNHKRDWGQTKLELMTLFHAIKFWEPYLKGTNFHVNTDCLSICSLDTIFRKNDATLRRKIQSLAEYSFTIGHLPASNDQIRIADFWSRYPYNTTTKTKATQCDLSEGQRTDPSFSELVNKVTILTNKQNERHEEEKTVEVVSLATDTEHEEEKTVEVVSLATDTEHEEEKTVEVVSLTTDTEHEEEKTVEVVSLATDTEHAEEKTVEVVSLATDTEHEEEKTVEVVSLATNTEHEEEKTVEVVSLATDTVEETGQAEKDTLPSWFFSSCGENGTDVPTETTKVEEKHCVCKLLENSSIEAKHEHKDRNTENVSAITGDEQDGRQRADGSNRTLPDGTSNTYSENSARNHNPSITELSSLLQAIAVSQASDPILSTVRSWLLTGTRPNHIQAHRAPKELVSYWQQFELLQIRDNVVMRRWLPLANDVSKSERFLSCIPDDMQETVLKLCHASRMVNHPGINNTLEICKRYFYWPGLTRDVKLYVNACTTCGQMKQPRSYSKAKRNHIIAHKFNDIIQIDHIELEKLGLSSGGKKYILSITDVWSGFVVAVSTRSQKAEDNISLIMHNWVLKHGVPRNIISDGAPGFKAKFYKSVLTALNCKFDYGLPYECKSTSIAERMNKNLNQSLRLILQGKDPRLWDRYLNYVCSVLNSLKSRRTGYSPNFLANGRENNTPLTLLLENSDSSDVFGPGPDNYYDKKAYKRHLEHKKIIAEVSKKLKSYYAYSDMSFNRGIMNPPFKEKELCYVRIRCPTHKLSPRWYGPVPIVKVINNHVYVVKLPNGEKVVNISKLKRYKASSRWPPGKDTDTKSPTADNRVTPEIQVTPDQSPEIEVTVSTTPNIPPSHQLQQDQDERDVIVDQLDNLDEEVEPEVQQAPRRTQRRRIRTTPIQIDPSRSHYDSLRI